MGKQWIKFADNGLVNNSDKRREHKFDVAIKNVPKRTIEKMKEDQKADFAAMKQDEAKLMKAFEEKKLKSKTAIKQALAIKKLRDKENKKAVTA